MGRHEQDHTENSDAQAYDPAADPDSDPDNLAPRTGDQATSGTSEGDPDADPDMLNPRQG